MYNLIIENLKNKKQIKELKIRDVFKLDNDEIFIKVNDHDQNNINDNVCLNLKSGNLHILNPLTNVNLIEDADIIIKY
jgi:hypothetical protein